MNYILEEAIVIETFGTDRYEFPECPLCVLTRGIDRELRVQPVGVKSLCF